MQTVQKGLQRLNLWFCEKQQHLVRDGVDAVGAPLFNFKAAFKIALADDIEFEMK